MVNNFPGRSPRPDNQPTDPKAGGRPSSAPIQSLGALLRERREAMGVTLAEVEVATRIRQKYLSALESDEWHLLPGEVVGRGFLRNYADYLALDPQEVMDRRRALTDPNMNTALSTTSAGAPLPPERQVDYRPKEVDLKDEGDGIQRGEIRLTPILAILALAAVVALGVWGVTAMRSPLRDVFDNGQTSVAGLFDGAEATATSAEVAGVVNAQNLTPNAVTPGTGEGAAEPTGAIPLGSGGGDAGTGDTATAPEGGQPAEDAGAALLVPTATPAQPAPAAVAPTDTPAPPTPEPVVPPTDTPAPLPPTPTPIPPTPVPPTPTPEPVLPTDTPTPEPPAVVAASCADARSVISSPGVGQVVAGVTGVAGTATHEAFQYYKLEYAPGANAAGGFVYFDGSNVQISGGLLGNLDTTVLANGDYTIRLTVVDQSGNFPPPCDVSVVVQN